MKLRAKANGMVVDVSDADAPAYLGTGLYEPVDEPSKSTKAEPLTTKHMAPRVKKVKAK
jgi:hypothetical protein